MNNAWYIFLDSNFLGHHNLYWSKQSFLLQIVLSLRFFAIYFQETNKLDTVLTCQDTTITWKTTSIEINPAEFTWSVSA